MTMIDDSAWMTRVATWPSSPSEMFVDVLLDGSCRRTSPDCLLRREDGRWEPLGRSKARRWGTQGILERGACLTGRGSEHPDVVITCSLSDIAERPDSVPSRYFYTPRQCRHMLRRAARRGKTLPERLRRALERQARVTEYLEIVRRPRRRPTRREAEVPRPAPLAGNKSHIAAVKAASLFSGIGAPEAAMPDWNWLWGAEIDPFCSAVLAERLPNCANLGDVTADGFVERAKPHGRPDVVVFGSPCQAFSIAGRRLGMDDPRGNLALVALRIVREIAPRWFVFENVPGLLSSTSDGSDVSDFGAFLAAVEDAGYLGAWRVLDARWFGVPQHRRRIFLVAHRGEDWRPPVAVLLQRESMFAHAPPRIDAAAPGSGEMGREGCHARALMTRSAIQYMPDVGGLYAFLQSDDDSVSFWTAADDPDLGTDDGRAGTLTTRSIQDKMSDHNDRFYGLFQDGDRLRRPTPRECERLQGFPDFWTLIDWRGRPAPDGFRWRALGNAMAVPVIRWVLSRIEAFEMLAAADTTTFAEAAE
jgi:DNA (cytosine-5)-methyltransferase 1